MFVKANVLATALALAATALAASVSKTSLDVQCPIGPLQCCYTLPDDQIAVLGRMVSSVQARFLPSVATNGTVVESFASLASSFAFVCRPAGPDGYCFPGTQPRCCEFDGYGLASVGCWAPSTLKA